ncbi:MAG: polyphosphate kinase 1 [Synechococcales bacterium]|nr:polyphosphate kinase 1 [Synechococcales bacterium]
MSKPSATEATPDKPRANTAPAPEPATPLTDPQYYLNRELSWLEFNDRVLHEATDPRTPLLERLKFMAIFSSNLDEFFMVRVAVLQQQVEAGVSQRTPDGRSPQEQLNDICKRLRPMVKEQHEHFAQVLRGEMAAAGIHLLDYGDLSDRQQAHLQNFFKSEIFPILTPLAVDPGHPFPYISNLSLNLAVVMKDPQKDVERFARVKVPPSRFVPLPDEMHGDRPGVSKGRKKGGDRIVWAGVPLEQVIAHNLEFLFPGMDVQEHCFFRITRNADLEVEEDEADDLMLAIEKELRKRRLGGSAVRMEIQTSAPPLVRETLVREMGLTDNDVYELPGLLGLGDLMSFMGLPLPHLKDAPWTPVVPPRLQLGNSANLEDTLRQIEDGEDMFSVIRQKDLLVHHPYHSFSATVQRFITQAAHDPQVLAIKMTLYRTSGDSPIVDALICAAENGKQVVALVELKARFDEQNNILWARKLEKSGVHVVYGFVELKTHTKVVLVVRREESGIRRYFHIGTGNYNPKTAHIYTDLGLFSCADALGADLTELFNYLTGYSRQRVYRKLLIAPVNLRDRMVELIARETTHARAGRPAKITAKMNALVDSALIQQLYEASQAGVQIDLVVRGICCLRPGLPGVSENIRVVSVVGRLLEHSRIFYFFNDGSEEVYIGSADWMPRNLDRRVEAVTPIEDPDLMADLKHLLNIMLNDNRHAWDLQPNGHYHQRRPQKGEEERSAQDILMRHALQSAN